MLDEVRITLLGEARNSPTLLSDLAGLEQYISESYESRSFVELLQNADDAQATKLIISKHEKLLLVANNGKPFDRMDFETLCRSAASRKTRGETIGYRGIGFKSVLAIARTVHLLSGDLEVTFSRQRTSKDIPTATRVPLLRIPHTLLASERDEFQDAFQRLKGDNASTVFVFSDTIPDAVEREFQSFDPSSLLFLRNVSQVELRSEEPQSITLQRKQLDDMLTEVRLTSRGDLSQWLVWSRKAVSLALLKPSPGVPILNERDAVAHAFLPTADPTGIAAKIHGDFSTDPSRTRVVLDQQSQAVLEAAANLIIDLVEEVLLDRAEPEMTGILPSLMPTTDPRLSSLQRRSLKTDLHQALKSATRGRFASFRLRPSWLNSVDFSNLSQTSGQVIVPRQFEEVRGLTDFLRFLGVADATFTEIVPQIGQVNLTTIGASEIVSQLITLESIGQLQGHLDLATIPVWSKGGRIMSLKSATTEHGCLDTEFLDLIVERTGSMNGLARLTTRLAGVEATANLLPRNDVTPTRSPSSLPRNDPQRDVPLTKSPDLHLRRWRRTEEHVLAILVGQGWNVDDVSRQFLGYDIEGHEPNGEPVYVEVKSIDFAGQPFTLTSNEEATAREKAERYILALVKPSDSYLEIVLIRDPARKLSLTRQCKQWVWECASYPFSPDRLPLE